VNPSAARTLIAVLGLAMLSYAIFRATRPPELPAGFIYGNGHIEGTEIRIASELGGRVLEQHLVEGAPVAMGDLLLVLDSQNRRDRVRAARGERAALQESAVALDAQIATWTHHRRMAERQLTRVQRLSEQNVAPDRDLDEAENGVREARGQLEALKADRSALERRIAALDARVQLAENEVEKTEVHAPSAGTVLVRAVEVGEVVLPGQALGLLMDLSRLELKVYVPGSDLGKLVLGDPARVRIDAFSNRDFSARVSRIDDYAQFTPRDIHVPEERTRMVYGVTLMLDNPDGVLKPGMPADAWIRWDDAQSWPESLPIPRS